jgi:hypothetical protein
VFNIFTHKGNANQKYTKILSHLSQIGHNQENKQKCWRRCGRWRERNLHTLLMRVNEDKYYGNQYGVPGNLKINDTTIPLCWA